MATRNLDEVQQTGLVPNVTNLRCTLQATGKTEIKLSKKGRRQAVVPMEIISPVEPVKDRDGNSIVVAGSQLTMYIQLDDKGLAQGTADLHKKAKLPLQFDPDNDAECIPIYNSMCIVALLSSEEQPLMEFDPLQGKEVAAKDENGNAMKGQYRWKIVGNREVVGPGKRIDDFTTV